MTAEEALRRILLASPALAALVADRVEPAPLTQGCDLPAITFLRVSSDRLESFDGPSGLVRVRIQLDIWAQAYGNARSLFDLCRGAANGYSGYIDGQDVQKVKFETDQDFYEPDTKLRRVAVDVLVWTTEAV